MTSTEKTLMMKPQYPQTDLSMSTAIISSLEQMCADVRLSSVITYTVIGNTCVWQK